MNRDDGTANIFLRTGDNTGTNRQTLNRGKYLDGGTAALPTRLLE